MRKNQALHAANVAIVWDFYKFLDLPLAARLKFL